MNYRETFDHTGKRRIFTKPAGHWVAGVVMAIGAIVVLAVLTGGFQS